MKALRATGWLCVAWVAYGCAASGDGWDEEGFDSSEVPGEGRPKIKGGSEATAYPQAVAIDMDGGASSCSGSLIAPGLVLTAGHCVYQFSSFDVSAPYAQQQSSGSKSAVFDFNNTGDSVDPNTHDVGVIFLDYEITISEYLQVASMPVAFGSYGQNIGRIDNGQFTSQLFLGPPVEMKDGKAIGYPYDYYSTEITEPGDSGGPVVIPGGPPYTVIGVNSGGGGGEQITARTDLVYQWLQDQISASGGSSSPAPPQPPQPPPGGGTCDHGPCEAGAPLDPNCDPCVQAICSYDDYCCNAEWDDICTEEAMYICGAC